MFGSKMNPGNETDDAPVYKILLNQKLADKPIWPQRPGMGYPGR